jgi:hypothetical protein
MNYGIYATLSASEKGLRTWARKHGPALCRLPSYI